jgi:hypothetical protein
MIFYCDEEQDVYVAVYSADLPEDKLIKKLAKISGIDFEKTSTIPEELEPHATLAFEIDTIILCSKDYNEDFVELSEQGIGIYIVP